MGIPIIGDIIQSVIGGAKDIVSEVVVDKDKRAELNVRLAELADRENERVHEQLMGQIATNQVEAANSSVFVAGWRPFVGWVCGLGLGWNFVFSPLLEFVARIFGWEGTMPQINVGELSALLLAMLGMSAMRTVEKSRGVSTPSVG